MPAHSLQPRLRGIAPRPALIALLLAALVIAFPPLAHAAREDRDGNVAAAPEACDADCWTLSEMKVAGAVTGSLSFELRGGVRSKGEQKIPLFGPPGQLRLDDVTIDGARATVTFDNDRYYVITSSKAFTLRGKMTLGSDQMMTLAGPLPSLDAHLSKGRLVEGERLSGLADTVLHFDPLSEAESPGQSSKPRTPPAFRLSRALRYGHDTTFVYRIVASQGSDLGTLRLPLKYGEKVQDVQGAVGWTVESGELLLPTSGHEADLTISGSMPAASPRGGIVTFGVDERSAYEWWLIEVDPEHRVSVGGEAKLVDTSQSPIPPTLPGARVYLLQRSQQLEVDAKSLIRGDVLAAVARTNRRFVAITGSGELISDETIAFDNNGLDQLMLMPAGRAMYMSTDAVPQPIVHTELGTPEVLVAIRPGSHHLRVQSLANVALRPFAGAVTIPSSSYPLATSAMEMTVGLPEHIHPMAIYGGDRMRSALCRADFVAVAFGIAIACLGFRTRQTRALGAITTAGLWFVSHEAFVFAAGALFIAGATFLASRFFRSTKLVIASTGLIVVALFTGRFALTSDAELDPSREMLARGPQLPVPEASQAAVGPDGSLDTKATVRPVSLSLPTSEQYVQTSRQLVTRERPFIARIVYVTHTLVVLLHLVWLALAGALAWAHKDHLAGLKQQLVERIKRRPAPIEVALRDRISPF